MDAQDWTRLAGVLGEDLLAELLGVPTAALAGLTGAAPAAGPHSARTVEIQARGWFLRLLVGDLLQTRDTEGARLWFRQRQQRLPGGTPAAAARAVTHHDAPEARQLRELASTADPERRTSRNRRRMLDLVRFEQGEPERRDFWRGRRV